MSRHAGDGTGLKEVGRVFQPPFQAIFAGGEAQGQVGGRDLIIEFQRADGQRPNFEHRPRFLFEIKPDLHQRVMASVSGRLELLDQSLKREFCVRLRLGQHALHPAEQLADIRVTSQICAEHQRVGKIANHPRRAILGAVESGRANNDVPAAGIAREQRLKSGQQHGREIALFARADRGERLNQGIVEC